MDDANERLSRAWGQVSHLNAVVNSPELREIYNANLPLVTQYYAELGQDQALFEKFKQLRNSEEFEDLNRARKKIVENELRDFRLGGAELAPRKKSVFSRFRKNCRRFLPGLTITCWMPRIISCCIWRMRMSCPVFLMMCWKWHEILRKKKARLAGNLRCMRHLIFP